MKIKEALNVCIYMAKHTLCSIKPSGNKKLSSGKNLIYSTYRPTTTLNKRGETTYEGTCPKSCPLLGKCYANFGFTNIQNLRSRERNDNVTDWILSLPKNSIVRHLVSGDLINENNEIDLEYINETLEGHKQRPDVKGYAYTHAWKDLDVNYINQLDNFTVNASCQTKEEVTEALSKGWPVVKVAPLDTPKVSYDKDIVNVVCPNQINKVTCDICKLCAIKDRVNGKGEKVVVNFLAHAVNKNKISNIVKELEQ